jgi:putative transposase
LFEWGFKPVSKEVRALIFRRVTENPTWEAPRIHGELLKLGFDLCLRAPDLAKHCLTFLKNHRESIAAMDFFTVPTLTFGVSHCFFIMAHDRRKILCFNVTRNPNAPWIVQQLREAWPYAPAHEFLLFDHDSKFGHDVVSAVKEMGSRPTRTEYMASATGRFLSRIQYRCGIVPQIQPAISDKRLVIDA